MKPAALLLAAGAAVAAASPLWDYVNKDDGMYSWFDTGATIESSFYNLTKDGQWKGYVLNVTSQKWLTPADFAGPYGHIWSHQVVVIVPAQLDARYTDHAAIYITGNGNGDSVPDASDEDILVAASIAVGTGTVTAVLFQIPNAPIVFTSDPSRQGRSEDAMVAWTWRQFMLEHPDMPEWTAYYPMCKGAIKAMDAVTEYMASKTGAQIAKWVVAGASKRGATTWYVGAVDPRVVGLIPMVFSALNFTAAVDHMWQSLGNWSFALQDYLHAGVMQYLNDGTGRFQALSAVVDPLVYKENMTMPKLVVSSTGDEFFQLQDDHFWWGQLPNPDRTYRLIIDNAEHTLSTGILTLVPALIAFYKGILDKAPTPQLTWNRDVGTGAISITVTGLQPTTVVNRVGSTLNGKRRDFRLVQGNTTANPCTDGIPVPIFGSACIVPLFWTGNKVGRASFDPATNVSTWTLTQDAPGVGWRAFLGELYFPSSVPGVEYRVTTQASIIPAPGTPLYPFPLCVGTGCVGDIV